MPNYQEVLIATLKKQELPDFFRQENQILEEKNEYAEKASAYIRTIIDKLPKKYVKTDDIKIFISADPDPNAYVLKFTSFMVITKSFLELVKTEDELASIIAHELMHIDLRVEFPKHGNSNKVEESMCDHASIEALSAADYQTDAFIHIAKRFPKHEHDLISTLLDPHPDWETRIRNNSLALEVHNQEKYMSRKERATALPLFIEEGKKIVFPYYLDLILAEKNYVQLSAEEKMLLLAKLIQSEGDKERLHDSNIFKKLQACMERELGQLNINLAELNQKNAFGELMDAILDVSPMGEMKYGSKIHRFPIGGYYASELLGLIYKAAGLEDDFAQAKAAPYGKLKIFQDAVTGFVSAKNPEEAKHFAQQINSQVDSIASIPLSDIVYRIKLEGFTLSKVPSDELPWNKHLEWSKTHDEIKMALGSLGVLRFISSHYPKNEIEKIGYDFSTLDFKRIEKFAPSDLPQNSSITNGKMTYHLEQKPIVTTFASERERLKIRDKIESKMDVNWELMESDLDLFINTYAEQLKYPISFMDGGFAFAERVLQSLNELTLKEPVKSKKAAYGIMKFAGGKSEFPGTHKEGRWYEPGISVRHPFIQYALENSSDLIRVIPLPHIFYYQNEHVYFHEDFERANHSTFSYLPPIEKRWEFDYERLYHLKSRSIENLAKLFPGVMLPHFPSFHCKLFEAYRIINDMPNVALNLEEYATFKSVSTVSGGRIELDRVYLNQLSELTLRFFKGALKNNDPEYLIKCYHYCNKKTALFHSYSNIIAIEEKIKESYLHLHDRKQKQKCLELLLFMEKMTFTNSDISSIDITPTFYDATFKTWAINEYSLLLSDQFGKDDGQSVYEDNIKKIISEMLARNLPDIVLPLLKNLTEHLRTQQRLSYYIRDTITKETKSDLLSKGVEATGLEVILNQVIESEDNHFRLATIDFLLSADNNLDLNVYAEELCQKIPLFPAGVFGNESIDNAKDYYHDNPKQFIEWLESKRSLYRSMSFEKQILLIDYLFFPPHDKTPLEIRKKEVLDKLFGTVEEVKLQDNYFFKTKNKVTSVVGMLANSLTGRAVNKPIQNNETRQIVESYLEALEEVAKIPKYKTSIETRERLILSALLISHAKSQLSTKGITNRGDALSQILAAMGPAGRKLAQAISNAPETPEDIKNAMKSSKTEAAPPARWEVFEWAEKYYSGQGPDGIHMLGRMLGSGTFGVTMEAIKNSGVKTAITFLRPFMLEQSQDQYMILDIAANILIHKNPAFNPFYDMQREAAIASVNEVNMDVAARQQKLAEDRYQGLEVQLGDINFKFGIAEWIGYGPQYKETKIVEGYHFIDLHESEDLRSLKAKAGEAILTAEFYLLLKGGPKDNDRHSGNQKISLVNPNEIYVGNFDFGGFSLMQSTWQQKMLGNMIGEILWEVSKPFPFGRSLSTALMNKITEKYTQEYAGQTFMGTDGKNYPIGHQKAEQFAGRLKRGILALGDYYSALELAPQAMKRILGAIIATGKINPVILTAIEEKLGSYKHHLNLLAEAKETKEIKIQQRPSMR